MLPALPSSLKFVSSTLARAQELDTKEPIIAHYCRLHAAQQILAKGLHQTDSEVASFATSLLDQIEQGKSGQDESSPLSTEQAQSILNDEQTAYVYVENFALNVFAKADAEVYNKTSNKATASKFMAAAVFLDVLKVFTDELETTIVEKIKYSKFQASRILKDIKSERDPNEYDPPGEKVEEIGEIEEEEEIPSAPQDTDEESTPHLPDAPPVMPKTPDAPPKGTPTRILPGGPAVPSAPSWLPNDDDEEEELPSRPSRPAPVSAPAPGPVTPTKPITKQDVQRITDETQLVSNAQKHAKYAISALNYEDMDTAISELEKALSLLKTQSS